MYDLAIVSLLLTPNVVLAVTSRSGGNAGHYILAGWIALAVVGGVWPLPYFIYAALVLAAAAVLFRGRLRMGAFLAQRARGQKRLR